MMTLVLLWHVTDVIVVKSEAKLRECLCGVIDADTRHS